jgi:hypothetical protein
MSEVISTPASTVQQKLIHHDMLELWLMPHLLQNKENVFNMVEHYHTTTMR